MIVVDSSALIEFYRPGGRADVKSAVADAMTADTAAVNGIIQTEVVSFAKGKEAFETLKEDFAAFHWIDLTRETFDAASDIGHELRAEGITVPATDLIIAASCIITGATLYHLDRHFELLARYRELAQRSFLTSGV